MILPVEIVEDEKVEKKEEIPPAPVEGVNFPKQLAI